MMKPRFFHGGIIAVVVLVFGSALYFKGAPPFAFKMGASEQSTYQQEDSTDRRYADKSSENAKKYIEGVPKEHLNAAKVDPVNEVKQVRYWEDKILIYAKTNATSKLDPKVVTALAEKTSSLVSLLREAAQREQRGLDPYTGISEFNTMMLAMTVEKDFKDQLGLSFADFFADQNPDDIKQMIFSQASL